MVSSCKTQNSHPLRLCISLSNFCKNFRIWFLKHVFQFIFLICFFTSLNGCCEDEIIDLRTFLKERTQQYPHQKEFKAIYVNTPPRTGSTLVYNILRFLFESENHYPYSNNHQNLIIKTHDYNLIKKDILYVFTLRNPIDACFSHYLAYCSDKKKILPLGILDAIVHTQLKSIRYLERLILNEANIVILKYEDFVDDFDFLFLVIENRFSIFISCKDKIFLKKALQKDNVIKNIVKLESFSHIDEFSLFHGDHISRIDFPSELKETIKREIAERIFPYRSFYEKWGYF